MEDERFLRGEGKYLGDCRVPFMAEVFFVRSPHARARILQIDTRVAGSMPGVLAVFTAADLPADMAPIPCRVLCKSDVTAFLQPVLARDVVRYTGEPVAIVVASTRALAEDAAEHVAIEWEMQVAVSDAGAALLSGEPVHAAGHIATQWDVALGDVDSAFAEAAVRVTHRFTTPRRTGVPMETRGLLATYDKRRQHLEVVGPTKIPHTNRRLLSAILKIPESDIHFIEPDVGGSFGVRGEFYPEDVLIPWLAMRLSTPIRWIEDRLEHFAAINHSPDSVFEVSASADADGRITAFELDLICDMGAYIRTHGDIVPAYTAGGFAGPYSVRNFRTRTRTVMTNKTPTGTIRAPGNLESNFVRERVIDMLAAALKLPPEEIRRRNLIKPEMMPWDAGTESGGRPAIYDTGDYPAVFEQALREFAGGVTPPKRQGAIARGRGMSAMVEPSALGLFESARIEIDVSGKVRVVSGCTSQGQGQETTLAQVAAEVLGVPLEQISVLHGDTRLIAYGGGTNAARSAVMAGNAVHEAAHEVRRKAIAVAARKLEASEDDLIMRNGRIEVKGAPGSGLPLGTVARLMAPGDREFLASPSDNMIPDHEGLNATSYVRGVNAGTAAFALHLVDVAVDVETGQIAIERYLVACDVGRAINPMIVEGQLVGGVVQGIGAALLEEIVFGSDSQLQTASLADYLLPSAHDAPPVRALIMELSRATSNKLGVKGVGEVGPSGVAGAVANAIANALDIQNGFDALPITPERVLNAIAAAGR